MQNIQFERGVDTKKALRIGRCILSTIKDHPICKVMNDIESMEDPRDPNSRVYINPHNQYCFNYGTFYVRDLWLWLDGKGPVIKGETDEEKAKFWEYAVFDSQNPNAWSIRSAWPWMEEFQTDFSPHEHRPKGVISSEIKNRIKVPDFKTQKEELDIKKKEIIIAMYAPFVDEIVKELEENLGDIGLRGDPIDFIGIKRTLYCMGIGYLGANNTPEDICNLNWVPNIVRGKALYIYYKKAGIHLPDFQWLYEYDQRPLEMKF